MPTLRWLALSCVLVMSACGGGPTSDEPDPLVLPLPTGAIQGRISLLQFSSPAAFEREPNDTVDTAHQVADLFPGEARSVFGRLDSTAGDVFDAVRMRLPVRAEVTVTLRFQTGLDFEVALYDPLSMQFIAVATGGQPTLTLTYKGLLDLVVTTAAAQGSYELAVQAAAAGSVVSEVEPNDTPETGTVLGQLPIGDSVSVHGNADMAADPAEALLLSAPDDSTLSFHLAIPAFADFALRISDVTAGIAAPVHITTLDGATSLPRVGDVTAQPGTLLLLEVLAEDGAGDWLLDVSALENTLPNPGRRSGPAGGSGRVAGCHAEADCFATRRSERYGRFVGESRTGEALVGFCAGREDEGIAVTARRGCSMISDVPGVFCRVGFQVEDDAEQAERQTFARACALASHECVRYAEPNSISHFTVVYPNDEFYLAHQRWNTEMVNLPLGWVVQATGSDVVVAIIDSGSAPHPDLDDRWFGGFDFISDTGDARDGDGMDPDPSDEGGSANFHGTWVAGICGATGNNGIGVTGVIWDARLMPVRVGSDQVLASDLANAIRFSADLTNVAGARPTAKANVINMSLGSLTPSVAVEDACIAATAAGVTVIAAAGNGASNVPIYPAAFPSTISVGAVSLTRSLAYYSSYGPSVTVVAPGGQTTEDQNADGFGDGILSTHAKFMTVGNSVEIVGSYTANMGTSAAAPHVAGLAALLIAQSPQRRHEDIVDLLRITSVDLGATGRDDFFGYGLIDTRRALEHTLPPSPPSPPELLPTPRALSFSGPTTRRTVYIRNGGVLLLDVTGVEVSTDDGGPWLSAELGGSASAARSHSEVTVTVNRIGLPGTLTGQITIRSNGGDVTVPVVAAASVAPPPTTIPIYVRAIRPGTGEVVQEVVVNPAFSLSFKFPGIPTGTYLLVAGSDLDGDGEICEPGDFCGGFPFETSLEAIRVIQNVTIDRLNFDLTRKTSGP